MDPTVVALIVLVRSVVLPALGVFAGGLILAKTTAGRRLLELALTRTDHTAALQEVQAQLTSLQSQLDETQERLDYAERMLATRPRIAPSHQEPITPVTPM